MCGVATSPSSSQCASCGEDGTVRIWNLDRHVQSCSTSVGKRATCIAYHPSGKHVVVCVQTDKTNELVELESGTLKETRRVKTRAKKSCRVLRFSPDGRWLALGSNDHNIYLHDSADDMKCRHVLGKHNAIVENLDWTSDSRYLHSTCAGHELLFWDAERGQHMPGGATTLRDAEWSTWTCTLGWPVKGLNMSSEDQSLSFVAAEHDAKLLVCGYNSGNVGLVRYPCPEKAESLLSRGHASAMCRADWIHHDNKESDVKKIGFVTAGGRDASLIQWGVEEFSNNNNR